jgi:hypothetical protein
MVRQDDVVSLNEQIPTRGQLVGFGSSVWRREKASRRWVSAAARMVEVNADSM